MKQILLLTLFAAALAVSGCGEEEIDKDALRTKTDFFAGCISRTASKVTCHCMFDELEQAYGMDELKRMNLTGQLPDNFNDVMTYAAQQCH